jgi:fucose permease
MSLFFGAMIVGRIALSFLVRLIPITRILLFAESIALAGFLLFWLAPYVPLKFVGLFVAGLGISTMFPLGLSAGIGTASHLANIASARMSMAAGLAMLVMPLILGWLADYIELFRAFSIVIILLIVSAIITLSGDRITSKAAPHARPASMSPHSPASKTESSP